MRRWKLRTGGRARKEGNWEKRGRRDRKIGWEEVGKKQTFELFRFAAFWTMTARRVDAESPGLASAIVGLLRVLSLPWRSVAVRERAESSKAADRFKQSDLKPRLVFKPSFLGRLDRKMKLSEDLRLIQIKTSKSTGVSSEELFIGDRSWRCGLRGLPPSKLLNFFSFELPAATGVRRPGKELEKGWQTWSSRS